MTSGMQRDPPDEHRSSLASLSELRAQTLLASSIPASALIATVLPNQDLAISAGYAAWRTVSRVGWLDLESIDTLRSSMYRVSVCMSPLMPDGDARR